MDLGQEPKSLLILAKGELTNRGIESIYIEQEALTQLTKTKQNNKAFEIKKVHRYAIWTVFRFRKVVLVVWIIYLPPNNKEKQREIQQEIIKDITTKERNTYYIIRGDFNSMLDPVLDKKGKENTTRPKPL